MTNSIDETKEEREKSRTGDLSQPQHRASGGVDASPTSFKNAGEERRNSGEAKSRGREREKMAGVWDFCSSSKTTKEGFHVGFDWVFLSLGYLKQPTRREIWSKTNRQH